VAARIKAPVRLPLSRAASAARDFLFPIVTKAEALTTTLSEGADNPT
jgi:hypothetical protein